MPGGSALAARNLTSMKVVKGNAAENGSFDLRVDGTRNDVFELRAGSGKQMSAPLFVDRGGATVGESDAGALSCKQQEALAATQIMAAVANADTTCTTDADCVLVPKGTRVPRLVFGRAGLADGQSRHRSRAWMRSTTACAAATQTTAAC